MANYKTKDPQNPYRSGVLVGNYVEDKFGVQLANEEVSSDQEQSGQVLQGGTLPPCYDQPIDFEDVCNLPCSIATNENWAHRAPGQVPRRQLHQRLRDSKEDTVGPARREGVQGLRQEHGTESEWHPIASNGRARAGAAPLRAARLGHDQELELREQADGRLDHSPHGLPHREYERWKAKD